MSRLTKRNAVHRGAVAVAAIAGVAHVAGCPVKEPATQEEVISVEISPRDVEVEVAPGEPATVEFEVVVTRVDGSEEQTTAVAWTSSNLTVGAIDDDGVFVTTDETGGVSSIRATYLGVWDETELTVVYREQVNDGTAPPNADELLDETPLVGSPDAPSVLYPLDGVKMPRNTPRVTFMWDAGPVCNLFRLRFRSEVTQVDVYTTETMWIPDEQLWHTIAAANAGGTTTLELTGVQVESVGGVAQALGAPLTSGAPTTIDISRLDADGSIYYWNSSDGGGVYRIPFGTEEPSEFYGAGNYGHCVSCHVISPDGGRMVVTYDGGNGPMGMLSMAAPLDDGQAVIPYSAGRVGNFKTFSPDGDLLLSSYNGVLTVSDAHTGAALYDVPLSRLATMPSWSPRGDQIAVVLPDESTYGMDWVFNGGEIAILDVDAHGNISPAPRVIVSSEDGSNNYYPAFSPDGDWIAYNRSWNTDGTSGSWDSYDDPSATLMVVKADGTVGYELFAANAEGDLTNSWPGWGPLPDADVLWLTFSSKRPYGYLTSLDDNRPQIWVTAFDLEAASAGASDPSSAPFWLPFQDVETSNHIPAWGPF